MTFFLFDFNFWLQLVDHVRIISAALNISHLFTLYISLHIFKNSIILDFSTDHFDPHLIFLIPFFLKADPHICVVLHYCCSFYFSLFTGNVSPFDSDWSDWSHTISNCRTTTFSLRHHPHASCRPLSCRFLFFVSECMCDSFAVEVNNHLRRVCLFCNRYEQNTTLFFSNIKLPTFRL